MPIRIAANCIEKDLPHHAIATRDLRWSAREWYQAVHEAGVALAPDPRVHAAHRCAHDESKMIYVKTFGQKAMLRVDHIIVRVPRKVRVHAVAWLARAAMPNSI